jgi:hypothetical protein
VSEVIENLSAFVPVNASDNTWTLANNNAWTSKLTQGDYTVTVNLSSNGGDVTDSSSITTTIDTGKPAQPAFTLVDTGLSDNDGITSNGLITVNGLEVYSGLRVKCWVCVIYENTQSIFTYI